MSPVTNEWQFNPEPVIAWVEQNGKGAKDRLAVSIGLTRWWLDKLMKSRKLPNGNNLFALAEVIGCPVTDLAIKRKKKSA